MRFEDIRVISAAQEHVWAILTDVEHWPDWTPTMRETVRLDAGPFRIGSRVRLTQAGSRPREWTVTEFDDGQSFTWQAAAAGVRLVGRHALGPAADGTRTVNALTLTGPLSSVTGLILGGRTRKAIATESEALARRAASDS